MMMTNWRGFRVWVLAKAYSLIHTQTHTQQKTRTLAHIHFLKQNLELFASLFWFPSWSELIIAPLLFVLV